MGQLSVHVRVGCVWKDDRVLGSTMYVGMLGNITDMRRKDGELGDSVQVMSRSDMMLTRCPRLLGGRISGDGGVGDWLGHRGHDTPEM